MSVQTPASQLIARPDPAQIPLPAKIIVLLGESASIHPLLLQSLFIRAARGERLALMVGDNHFDAYRLARLARTHGFDPAAILSRLVLSRAFTCHQLLHRARVLIPQAPSPWHALYVIGLLDTFYDEDVRTPEAARLLGQLLSRLREIAARGLPVLITIAPPRLTGREVFVETVKRAADAYWQPAPPVLEQFNSHQLALPEML
jgi:hypothetical protein